MSINQSPSGWPHRGATSAFTLVEVVLAVAITALLFGGIIVGNTFTCRRAEWTGYSLAAQSLGVQQLEQARAAVWDQNGNDITNLNLINWSYNSGSQVGTGYSVDTLDIPVAGTNFVYATNFVTIRMLPLNNATNPPIYVQMVQIDTVWPFNAGRATKFFTNSIATYLAPDNRDVDSL
ncbi:MAG TPA: hypothetical protein VL527_02215 [Dongiaceae bacterium]|nr:hypothetical protein [Dongiaceae bacterium]